MNKILILTLIALLAACSVLETGVKTETGEKLRLQEYRAR